MILVIIYKDSYKNPEIQKKINKKIKVIKIT